MTPLPDLESLIDIVRSDAPGDDPLQQLAQASRSVGEIEDLNDALLDHFVQSCRASGCTWSEISSVLGVSKQAAHKRFASVTPTFERFTPRARAVLSDARERARAAGEGAIGTEHLLLALFGPAEALAAQVLRDSGLSRDAVQARLGADDHRPQGSPPGGGGVGYSPRAVAALRHAVDEALQLGHNYVGTEHLLLALFGDSDAHGGRILVSLGATYDDIRERLIQKFAAMQRAREAGGQTT
jgi:hypothetical protein